MKRGSLPFYTYSKVIPRSTNFMQLSVQRPLREAARLLKPSLGGTNSIGINTICPVLFLSRNIDRHLTTSLSSASTTTLTMNSIITTTLFAIIAMATVQSSSGLALFSPLLLRANHFGVASRQSSSSSPIAPQMSQNSSPSLSSVDYGHDDELLRYKYELLSSVYDKSLSRGFDNQE